MSEIVEVDPGDRITTEIKDILMLILHIGTPNSEQLLVGSGRNYSKVLNQQLSKIETEEPRLSDPKVLHFENRNGWNVKITAFY